MHPIRTTPAPFIVRPGTALRPALTEASALLACAMASAYEAADQHSGGARHAGLAAVHLMEMAKALVDATLETDHAAENAMCALKAT